jgi:choline transport protein
MIMASSGRILMSFAREGGLPFSSFFAKIDRREQLPVNALCFSAGLQALLVLIYIVSSHVSCYCLDLPS